MYEIEALWPPEKAARIRAMIEEATGQPCPCSRGKRCPILGDTRARERLLAWEAASSRPPIRAVS